MKVIGRKEIEDFSQGGIFRASRDMIITPLAQDFARERNIHIEYEDKDIFAKVAAEVKRENPQASEEDIRIAYLEVVAKAGGKAADNPSYYQRMTAGKKEKAVISVTGRNRTGVVAKMADTIAKESGDILDIQQTIVNEFFTMVIVVDITGLKNDFSQFRKKILDVAKEIGVDARIIHEGVLHAMHRI